MVIAGFLHDLIEDTNCAIKEIEENFGKKIADLVRKCTFDPELLESLKLKSTSDYKKSWGKEIEKILKYPKDVLIIKIADVNDNANYVNLIKNPEHKKKIIWKHRKLVNLLKPLLKGNEIFKELEKKVKSYNF